MEIDNFKTFIKTIPAIKEDVMKGKYNWQQLYEVYCLYGEDDELFNQYKKKSIDMNSMMDLIKNIDLNSISQNIEYIMKILDMFKMFTNKNNQQWYDD